jgi:hypothetical protein
MMDRAFDFTDEVLQLAVNRGMAGHELGYAMALIFTALCETNGSDPINSYQEFLREIELLKS